MSVPAHGGGIGGIRRLEAALLAAILLACALVRVAYFREHVRQPEFAVPEVDAAFNEYWARGLATGDWTPPPDREDPRIRSMPYLRPPGYPYFLAAAYRAFGTGPAAPRVVQAALGLASCLLAWAVARRRFGPAAGLAFAALAGSYWSFVHFEGEYLEPVLLVFLGLLLLRILDGWIDGVGPGNAVTAGVVLGAMALVRPTVLPFALVVPLWALRHARFGPTGARGKAASMLLFGASLAAAVSPAVVRNALVAGEPAIVSPAGLALYMGNREGADGRVASRLPGLGPYGSCFDHAGIVRALERRAGRPLSAWEVSAHFRNEGLRFVLGNPLRAAGLVWRKTLLLLGPLEVGHNREDEITRASSAVLRSLPGNFSAALAMFLAGLALFRLDRGREEGEGRRRAQAGLLAIASIYALCTVLAHVPFVVAGRYRVPMVPMLLLGGAVFLSRVGGMLRERRFGPAASWCAVAAGLYLLLSRNFAGYAPDEAKWHFTRGTALLRTGDTESARASWEEALRRRPGYAEALVNLGNLDLAAGDPASAERRFRAAVASAPDDAVARYDLALSLARQGRADEALAEYGRAIGIDPAFADAHADLAELLRAKGEVREAARHFGEAARLRRDRPALLALSVWLDSMGMAAEADAARRLAAELPSGPRRPAR